MSTAKAPAAPSDRICEKWYKLPPCMARNALGLEFGSAARVVCGTVYGDMHLNDNYVLR